MPLFRLFTFLMLAPLSLTCAWAAPALERKHYGAWEQDIGYTQVVKVGDRLYISGLTSGAKDMNSQITEIYTTLIKILADYQLTTQDIIKETVFTRDLEALKKAIPLRKTFYPKGLYPSASWVQVQRLYEEGFLIEVEVEAFISRNKR